MYAQIVGRVTRSPDESFTAEDLRNRLQDGRFTDKDLELFAAAASRSGATLEGVVDAIRTTVGQRRITVEMVAELRQLLAGNPMPHVILPEDPRAARMVPMEMWRSRDGALFTTEASARLNGATHAICTKCEAEVAQKPYAACSTCRERMANERHAKLPVEPWCEMAPIYSDVMDEWFNDLDSLQDALHEHGITAAQARLVHGKPLMAVDRFPDPDDIYADDLPEGQDELPDEVYEAFAKLREALAAIKEPICYWQSNVAVDPEGLDREEET